MRLRSRKTLGSEFEHRLLLTILKEPQTIILLDRGSGDMELNHTDSLMKFVKEKGYPVYDAKIDACSDLDITLGIIGLETRIGEIGAIIAQCDEYIGYDSAGQHIAAAVETPCLTIFAGSNNMRFLILPWVRVPHLASYILGNIARRISSDWLEKCGYPIYLLETFVKQERFQGDGGLLSCRQLNLGRSAQGVLS